ncbi:MAG: hypothetical protein K2Q24_15295 [Chitinophagaceae bacterium]|jgi:hypothetical protein|nr:hypothetical protein [Chitinophagaceae bacterium]
MEELWAYKSNKLHDEKTYLEINIENENVDVLSNYPEVKKLQISNIGQMGFERLIDIYGKQFEYISFFHCPLINDFSALSELTKIRCISFRWNNKATKLWDMSKNRELRAIYLSDLSKVKDFDELTSANALKELFITGGMWKKIEINSLKSIGKLENLEYLGLVYLYIIDNDISPLFKLQNLRKLRLDEKDFPVEYYAMLAAKLPNTDCDCFKGFIENSDYGKGKDTWIVGKRKPRLNKTKDALKIKQFIQEFEILKSKYL